MIIPNLDYLRQLTHPDFPGWGAKLVEALQAVQQQSTNHEQQTNSNPSGQPQAPPAVNGVNVTARNGHMTVSITDNNEVYRGVHYFVEHDSSPNFTNPQVVHVGTTRNPAPIAIGNQTRYVRVYSSYGSSPPSAPVYHGSAASPTAVSGGGSDSGPDFHASQGSGTGAAGQGLSGFGPIPFRTATGKPPTR